MAQLSCVGNAGDAPGDCLLRKAQTEQRKPQERLGHQSVGARLLHQRAMGNWIVQRQQLFQMRPAIGKSPGKQKALSGGAVT